jgi:hypothetical protein
MRPREGVFARGVYDPDSAADISIYLDLSGNPRFLPFPLEHTLAPADKLGEMIAFQRAGGYFPPRMTS